MSYFFLADMIYAVAQKKLNCTSGIELFDANKILD